MMNVKLPNGTVINNVPDGTSKEEIARKAIANGLAKPSDFPGLDVSSPEGWTKALTTKANPSGSWAAFGRSAIMEMAQAGDRLRHWLGDDDSPDEQRQMTEAMQRTAESAKQHPTASAAGEAAGTLAPMLAGWGAGEALAPEIGGAGLWSKGGNLLLKGAAGSVGSQLATGEAPTLGNTAQDVVVNTALNGIFGGFGKGIKIVKNALGKTDDQILKDAETLGVTPAMSTAKNSPSLFIAEEKLAKSSAGKRIMAARDKEQKDLANYVDNLVVRLGKENDSTVLGADILNGTEAAKKRFQEKSNELYDMFWDEMGHGTRVKTPNYEDALYAITNKLPDDPEIQDLLASRTLEKFRAERAPREVNGVFEPAPDMTIDALKSLRTRYGEMLNNAKLMPPDAEEADIRGLYSALTKDIEEAANQYGSRASWDAANEFYREGMELINRHMQPIFQSRVADNVYNSLFGAEGARAKVIEPEKASVLMSQLPQETADAVRAEVVSRLGKPLAGTPGGTEFSPDLFVTNWNRLKEGSKKALFPDADVRESLDAIYRYSSKLKELGRGKNTSNTAHYINNASSKSGAATMAFLTGHPYLSALILAPQFGGKISARLMTNPDFIRWAAKTTTSNSEPVAVGNAAQLLTVLFSNTNLHHDISDYVNSFPESQ
ncbi:hypothetical protein GZZ44_10495 [Klebsiella aerogenes]|uniref:DUF3054 domain-containing protein n=1 Tax=Klebsiella aerogenes TaxID=548 RepID=UPI00190E6649|nr:DUF3054 domain-containing protein [Klebsiella aerogenes]MBK0633376.1 hypothetical protein [Klebsiella aerogenes]